MLWQFVREKEQENRIIGQLNERKWEIIRPETLQKNACTMHKGRNEGYGLRKRRAL